MSTKHSTYGLSFESQKYNFVSVCPLWGARVFNDVEEIKRQILSLEDIDSDPNRSINIFKIDDYIELYIPGINEWRFIQPSESVDFDSLFLFEERFIPVCIKIFDPAIKYKAYNETEIGKYNEDFLKIIKVVVMALHLSSEGWFLNPFSSEVLTDNLYTFSRIRALGPFRLTYQDEDVLLPKYTRNFYRFQVGEIKSDHNILCFEKIYNLLKKQFIIESKCLMNISIDSFVQSYGYGLNSSQQISLLFMSLDSLIGGMSVYRVGRVKLKHKFKERLIVLLSLMDFPDYLKEVIWLDTKGRAVRNQIAHKGCIEININEDDFILRLRRIMRCCLIGYLIFLNNLSQMKPENSEEKKYSYFEIFNALLDKNTNLDFSSFKLEELLNYDNII